MQPFAHCDVIVTVEGAPKVEKNEIDALAENPNTEEEKSGDEEDADSGDGAGGGSGDTPPEA